MRPGVDVISRALPPPRSAPTDTGVAFVIGATVTGPAGAATYALVNSMTEYVAVFGDRTGVGQATYDWVDVYFREGGSRVYVSRTNPGAVAAVAESEVPDRVDLESRTRAELDTLATSIGIDPSAYDTKRALIDALVEPAPQALDAAVQTALDALTSDLGPGQIAIADPALAADVANQAALLAHCVAANRVALLTTTDGDAAALIAIGTAAQASQNGRYGALFAPSAVVPGIVAGTTRTVPYSAVEAGIIARNDVTYTPNQAAAGVLGQALYAIDVNGRYSDLDFQNLNAAGVSMARLVYGGVRTYGFRSCVAAATPTWLEFNWSRLNMAITAEAEEIGERYVFSQLDGRRRTISQFGGELSAMLAPYYDAGALYGETADDAYDVDVGIQINTEATIAAGELHAVLAVRMSPNAEWVVIEIVKVATTQALPATAIAA